MNGIVGAGEHGELWGWDWLGDTWGHTGNGPQQSGTCGGGGAGNHVIQGF